MSKKELLSKIKKKGGYSDNQTEIAYKSVIESLFEELIESNKVKIEGIGIIKIAQRKERFVKVPKKNDTCFVPSKKKLIIKGIDINNILS